MNTITVDTDEASKHVKIVCQPCGKLIAQCKCISEAKIVQWAICEECAQQQQESSGYGHGV